MTDLRKLMLEGGVSNVHDERVFPHDGLFVPIGVMVHHTGTIGPALAVIKNGRPGLDGPLAHLNVPRTGHVNVITDGLAYHAGEGSSVVLHDTQRNVAPIGTAAVRGLVDDTNGNAWFYGIEVDNDGGAQNYPDIQIAALVYACAALCKHHHWPAARVIHHKEWTRRKVDMSYTGPLRQLVGQHL